MTAQSDPFEQRQLYAVGRARDLDKQTRPGLVKLGNVYSHCRAMDLVKQVLLHKTATLSRRQS